MCKSCSSKHAFNVYYTRIYFSLYTYSKFVRSLKVALKLLLLNILSAYGYIRTDQKHKYSIQVAKIMFVISSPFSIVQFMELINVA